MGLGAHGATQKVGIPGGFSPHFPPPRLRWTVETGHCGKYFTQPDKPMYGWSRPTRDLGTNPLWPANVIHWMWSTAVALYTLYPPLTQVLVVLVPFVLQQGGCISVQEERRTPDLWLSRRMSPPILYFNYTEVENPARRHLQSCDAGGGAIFGVYLKQFVQLVLIL